MQRNFHLDQMRVISCIMVIAIHVCNIYNRDFPDLPQVNYIIASIVNAFSRISVPIFFMVSGALMAGKTPDISKSLKRFFKYLIITVFWFVFYLLWKTLYMQSDYDFHDILTTPTSNHLWFLYALLSIYLALPIIQTLIRALPEKMLYYMMVLFALSVFGGYILDAFSIPVKYPIAVIAENQYLGYFILGYVCYNNKDRIKTSVLVSVFLACGMLASFITIYVSYIGGEHNEFVFQYRNPLLVFMSASAFMLMMRFPKQSIPQAWEKFVSHISKNSFGIYVFHAVFLNVLDKNIDIPSVPAWCGIIVFTAIILLLSDICVHIFRKIKYINYFF